MSPAATTFSELHAHTNFSFLDGASPSEDLVARAVELGLDGLAVTDHQGLYGAVRFVSAAQEAGLRPIVGLEVELLDAAVPDPDGVVVPHRRRRRRGSPGPVVEAGLLSGMAPFAGVTTGPMWFRQPRVGRSAPVSSDCVRLATASRSARSSAGVRDRERGPHLVLLARDLTGYRSLCRLVSAAHLAGTKGVPRFTPGAPGRACRGSGGALRMPPR